MYTEYAEQYDKERAATSSSASRQLEQHSQQPPPQQSKAASLLATAISLRRPHQSHEAELESYFRGALGCQRWDDLLSWWKMNEQAFSVLSRMARDVLAASGVSISVERLFSVCRHVMTESRTAMTAKTASKTVCAKEWLHEGLGSTIVSFSGLPAAHDSD
ncbi:hypothetical protein FRC04_006919 [Tulasnella sp. 424]|nr:hypothetical protein FRC04_006919 [Tulasnella sp. 424]KAG8969721.1 hypothetical protein FRC05_000852 [Tulasnella sp. 425]